ncbi:MAG: VWA domain-containing protein [Endomicrobia bacterium]|nr:VWA domain-containing protein [Endomicrobiia bacterium]MDW8056316.1 VWA domain-containing protein [Elusimicrobiota bacterium]
MNFERPYVLMLLLFLPIVWWWLVNKKNIVRIKFSNTDILNNISQQKQNLDFRKILSILSTVSLMLLIISAAGPRKGIVSKEETKNVVDIMLCLDASTSMLALDYEPKTRFEVAVAAAKDFVKARKDDRIGIVVFSGVPILACPLTTDTETVIRFLDNSRIGMIKLDGTAIGDAIITCISRLKHEAKSKIIILLTDGRNNMGSVDPITAAKAAASVGIKIYTIGCGTTGGKSPYIIDDPFWGKRKVYLPQDLDEPTLIQIAEITGGKYYNVTSKEKMFAVFKDIDKLEKKEVKVHEYKEYKYLHQGLLVTAFFAFLARILLERIIFLSLP